MKPATMRVTIAALLVVGAAGSALARGGSDSGSGLSPYAAESGNDRSAGVNNGNYRNPRTDPYIRAYGGRNQPGYAPQRVPPGYYGYPY